MNFDELILHYGSAVKAAAALEVNRQTVHRWKESGIPLMRQYHIQTLSNRALKVDTVRPAKSAAAPMASNAD